MYHVNLNVNLMVENVIHIKSGIMISVGASAIRIIYVKKIIFGICSCQIGEYLQVLLTIQ